MRSLAFVLLASVAACHAVERAGEPDFGDAQSALVVAIGTAREHAIAVASDEGALHLPPLVQNGDLDLWALTFSCPLERTGLPPGELSISSAPAGVGFAYEPVASFNAPAARKGTVTWSAREPSEDVRSVLTRLPATDLCESAGRFTTRKQVLLPNAENEVYAFMVRVDADRAVAAAASGNYYWITRNGEIERFTLETGRPLIAAFVRADGLTFAVDQAGATYAGSFDDGFEAYGVTSSSAVDAYTGQLVGPRSDAEGEFELFLASTGARRAFARFDGERWTTFATRPASELEPLISVAWVGPGEAVTFGVQASDVATRYRDGILIREQIRNRNSVVSVHQHPIYGTVATLSRGHVYGHDGTAWRELFEAGDYANAATPVGSALWVTSVFDFSPPQSAMLFWDDQRGACRETAVDGFNRDLVALDETTFLLVNQIDFNGTFYVEVIDLEVPFARCGAP